jgi:hypothetical protein
VAKNKPKKIESIEKSGKNLSQLKIAETKIDQK